MMQQQNAHLEVEDRCTLGSVAPKGTEALASGLCNHADDAIEVLHWTK
jgi:hypothetical protein